MKTYDAFFADIANGNHEARGQWLTLCLTNIMKAAEMAYLAKLPSEHIATQILAEAAHRLRA